MYFYAGSPFSRIQRFHRKIEKQPLPPFIRILSNKPLEGGKWMVKHELLVRVPDDCLLCRRKKQ
jgi:hypothetical protein